MQKIMIGIMGPGENATIVDLENAYQLGKLIAQQEWVLLTGGRNVGVMDAASRGAKALGGLTVGVLPHHHTQGISEAIDIAIITDMGNARNNINALSSKVIIACGMGLGTVSEIALALKNDKSVILLTDNLNSQQLFLQLAPNKVFLAKTPEESILLVKEVMGKL